MDDFEVFCLVLERGFGGVAVQQNKVLREERARLLPFLSGIP
jgi:hypothetical protein